MHMDTYTAVCLIEGDIIADEASVLDAWQHLVDTGIVWKLQGSYGRMAADLIDTGLIVPCRVR